MQIMGSEFIVEMRAAEALAIGDRVCTLEYTDENDIDDEEAYSASRHPDGLPCGTCVGAGPAWGVVLVKFPDEKLSHQQNVLLHTLNRRRTQRILPVFGIGEKAK